MLCLALLLLAQEAPVAAAAPAQEPAVRTMRLYDVEDLLPDPALPADPPSGPMPDSDLVDDFLDGRPFESGAALAECIEAFLWPALDREHEFLRIRGGALLANLRHEQHAWLQRFLDAHRGLPGWMGQVEARFYRVERGAAAQLGLERSATVLHGDEAAEDFLARMADRAHELLSSPSLMTYPGQRANVSVLAQVAYVKDYELKIVEPGGVEIADPVVDTLEEGNVLDVRVLALDEGLYGMRLRSTVAQLQRPIKTRTLRLGPGPRMEVEVGVPEVVTAKLDADLRMRDGDAVVLFSPSADESELLIVVRFRAVAVEFDRAAPADEAGR